jgi:hypothetical protein
MSAYLNVSAVTTALAAVSIPGVTIKTPANLPDNVTVRDCPMLAPAPNYLSAITVEQASFGAPADMRGSFRYSLTYRYYHVPIGSARNLSEVYGALVDKVDAIISAAWDNSNLSGTVEMWPSGASAPGVVTDPAGNNFLGCDISFDVLVFVR